MRKPTDRFEAWAYWRRAIAGEAVRIDQDEIRCGFYRARKDGRHVAISIDLEQALDDAGELVGQERFVCLVDGVAKDAERVWPYCCAHPITQDEHDRLRRAPVVTDLTRAVVV